MPKISEEDINRIKREVPIVPLAESYGLTLKPQGKDYITHCVWHDDKTASLIFSPKTNLYHCMGACNEGGNTIQFVMKMDGISFTKAYEKLAQLSPALSTTESSNAAKKSQPPCNANPSILDEPNQKAAKSVIEFYHNALQKTPLALAYLQERGLNHPELLTHFQIGCAHRALSQHLPARKTDDGKRLRDALKKSGLLKSSGHEFFSGCITFPIFKEDGRLGEVYGRRFSSPDPRAVAHLYLPGSHQGIFNHDAMGVHEPLILCESIIDALSFWCHDFRHVTASFGVNGLTEEMLTCFEHKAVQHILIAYDNDDAGNKAANRVASLLLAQGKHVSRIMLPKGMDINAFMQSQQNPKQALQSLIDNHQSYQPPQSDQPPTPTPTEPVVAHPKTNLDYDGTQAIIHYGDREYRLRGIERNHTLDQMKVQLRIKQGDAFFLDTLDLASHRQRHHFIEGAAEELQLKPDAIKRELGQLLLEVENLILRLIKSNESVEASNNIPPMSDTEQHIALNFLKQENLLDQIVQDFETMGLVGENINKLVSYLAATSRKLDEPLAIMIQSSSSAGKSTLMDSVLTLMPPEDCQKWTAITEQALYYVDEDQLKHKVLAVSEDEGAEKANYPLKNLITDQELRIASTIKDPKSGEFRVQERCVKGPTAVLLTTTQAQINDELINRFLRLTIEESAEQTQKIHQRQRQAETLQGLEAKLCQQKIQTKHHNAQRLLKPLRVVNPYAPQLTFISDYLRNRRDQKKYLALIKIITFIQQYQHEVKHGIIDGESVDYIEVTPRDIEQANRLISDVLGRCLDELAPQTRRLLELILNMVTDRAQTKQVHINDIHFTRREVREVTHWSDSQLKVHMRRLLDLEYMLALQGGRGQSFVYELIWTGEGQDGSRFIPGLVDPKKLKKP